MSNIYFARTNEVLLFARADEVLQLTLLSQNTSKAEPPSGFARFLPSLAYPSLHPWRRGEPRYPQPGQDAEHPCAPHFHFISLSAIFLLHLKNRIFFILIDGAKVRKKIEKRKVYLLFLSKKQTLKPLCHS